MKARKFLFAVMTFATVALFNACSEDPCDGVTCNGHGTPTEVLETCTCDCDPGYSGDNCEDEDLCATGALDCGANGDCSNNACNCDDGYEGDTCQIVSREKFLGNYTADDNCTTTDYPVEIIPSTTLGVDKIILKAFGKYNCSGVYPDVIATVDESSITIAAQTFCTGNEFTIDEGSGIISANEITINLTYKTTYTGAQESCTVTLAKQ